MEVNKTENITKNIMIIVPRLYGGGAERVAVLWANFFTSNKLNVYLLSNYPSNYDYEIDPKVVRLFIADSENEYKKISVIKSVILTRNYIKKFNCRIIIPFLDYLMVKASLASSFLNTKIVCNIRNNPWLDPYKSYKRKIRDFFVYKHKNLILQCNEQAQYFNLAKIKPYIIPNIINSLVFEYKKDNYFSIKKILCIGRYEEQKNYIFVLKVILFLIESGLKDIHLDIYGEGTLKDSLKTAIANLNLVENVSLKPYTKNIYEKMVNYDLFILASKYEGFPNSLLEAMAVGLPVITNDCKTGPKDIIEDNVNGYLLHNPSVKDFGNKILEINEEQKLRRIGQSARNYVKDNFSTEIIGKKLLKFYLEISKN